MLQTNTSGHKHDVLDNAVATDRVDPMACTIFPKKLVAIDGMIPSQHTPSNAASLSEFVMDTDALKWPRESLPTPNPSLPHDEVMRLESVEEDGDESSSSGDPDHLADAQDSSTSHHESPSGNHGTSTNRVPEVQIGSLPPGHATSITGQESSHDHCETSTLDILDIAGHTLRLRVMDGEVDNRHVSVAHGIQLRTTKHNGRTASDAAGGRLVTIALEMSPCADNRSQLSAASPTLPALPLVSEPRSRCHEGPLPSELDHEEEDEEKESCFDGSGDGEDYKQPSDVHNEAEVRRSTSYRLSSVTTGDGVSVDEDVDDDNMSSSQGDDDGTRSDYSPRARSLSGTRDGTPTNSIDDPVMALPTPADIQRPSPFNAPRDPSANPQNKLSAHQRDIYKDCRLILNFLATKDMRPVLEELTSFVEQQEAGFSRPLSEVYSDSSDSGSVHSGNMEIDSYCD